MEEGPEWRECGPEERRRVGGGRGRVGVVWAAGGQERARHYRNSVAA